MTNACANFSFRGLRKKKNFTLFRSFRHAERNYFRNAEKNYFCHADKLQTSQQRQPHTKYTNSTRTQARFYYGRSRLGLQPGTGCAGIKPEINVKKSQAESRDRQLNKMTPKSTNHVPFTEKFQSQYNN